MVSGTKTFILVFISTLLISFSIVIVTSNTGSALSSSSAGSINCGINPHAPPCCLQPTKDTQCPSNIGGVELRDIHTDPAVVHVNTTFSINATVVNNSPNNITLNFLGCGGSPLSAKFDKNVVIGHRFCNLDILGRIIVLEPRQATTVAAPDYLHIYEASGVGSTNANVTLTYGLQNSSAPVAYRSVSKSLIFEVTPRSIISLICPNHIPGTPCL